MSELVCLSVSQDTAPVAWRERLAVPAQTQGAAAVALVRARAAGEALVLATCGRVDTYAVAAHGDRAEAALLEDLARRARSTPEALTPYVHAIRGASAARHLMRTAAGLDSPVLGEPEILGQLRRAHERARRAGATGPVLDRLVRDALRAGRRARPSWAATCSASTRTPGRARKLRRAMRPSFATCCSRRGPSGFVARPRTAWTVRASPTSSSSTPRAGSDFPTPRRASRSPRRPWPGGRVVASWDEIWQVSRNERGDWPVVRRRQPLRVDSPSHAGRASFEWKATCSRTLPTKA